MKIKYDKESDIISFRFSDEAISESDEDKPGIIFDYDKAGNIVSIEVIGASKKMGHLNSVEYEFAWIGEAATQKTMERGKSVERRA